MRIVHSALVIGAGNATVSIYGSPAAATVGSGDVFVPYISGGTPPYSLSLASGTLPPGRTMSGTAIVGAYTTAGTYTYTLRGTDSSTPPRTADLPVNLTVAAAPVTPTVTLSASQSKAEGNSGATAFIYTVTRSATAGGIAVPWSFAAGTTSADDFVGSAYPAGGSVVFADGVASNTFTVSVAGDTTAEADETFTISIVAPSGYASGASMSATGTILNDDAAAPTLATLALSPTSATAATAYSGTIAGRTAGSAITATSSDGTALTVSGATLSGTFAAAGSPTVTLTETLAGATGSPKASAITLTVAAAAASAPVNSAAPAISGTPQVGQTLTASTGTWSNSPTGYAYQWAAGGTAIAGATAATYQPVAGDVGKAITVTVTATNGGGSASATSAATAAVAAAASGGTPSNAVTYGGDTLTYANDTMTYGVAA